MSGFFVFLSYSPIWRRSVDVVDSFSFNILWKPHFTTDPMHTFRQLFFGLFLCTLLAGCNPFASKENETATIEEERLVSHVMGDRINLRQSPTIDSKSLGLLHAGDEVTVLENGIQGKNREAILKRDTDFHYNGSGRFAMKVNKGRAIKILDYSPRRDEYEVYLYMKGDKILATVEADLLEFLDEETWVKIATSDGTEGYCLQKYISSPTRQSSGGSLSSRKEVVEETIFQSTTLGYVEYMKQVVYEGGSYDWLYYTAKNTTPVKLGITEVNGMENVFFLNKPNVLYEIGGSECGFGLIDPNGVWQWYGQVSPKCNLSDY
jgi:hypothetical protein